MSSERRKLGVKVQKHSTNHSPPFKARDRGLGMTPADCGSKMARDLPRRGRKWFNIQNKYSLVSAWLHYTFLTQKYSLIR